MKKIIALVLALTMIFAFAACAKTPAEADDTNVGDGATNVETLTMATNASFPPYEYVEDDGSFAGIDVEIATAIAERLGMKLEIVDTEFGSIIGGVQAGKYDIGMAGMTVTDERKESVNFSNTYATAKQVVIVKEDSEIADFTDLYTEWEDEDTPKAVKEGVKIGVQQDTTGDIYASSDPADWGFGEGNVIRYKTGNDAVASLVTDKVDLVIIDNEPAKSYVAANKGLKILDGAYADEEYAICIAKENTELLDKINVALEELTAEGKIDEIVVKYIPAE